MDTYRTAIQLHLLASTAYLSVLLQVTLQSMVLSAVVFASLALYVHSPIFDSPSIVFITTKERYATKLTASVFGLSAGAGAAWLTYLTLKMTESFASGALAVTAAVAAVQGLAYYFAAQGTLLRKAALTG
jgi:hypothetical protein